VFGWVSRHVGYPYCDSIAHANNAELGYWVLFKVFGDEFGGVSNGESVACGSEVLLYHCEGEVEDENQMANDSSLERRSIPE